MVGGQSSGKGQNRAGTSNGVTAQIAPSATGLLLSGLNDLLQCVRAAPHCWRRGGRSRQGVMARASSGSGGRDPEAVSALRQPTRGLLGRQRSVLAGVGDRISRK